MPSHAIFDGHIDLLSRLLKTGRDPVQAFLERSDDGHLDLPRAREGGFAGGLFSVFVDANPQAAPPASALLGRDPDGAEVRFPRPLTLEFAQRVAAAELGVLYRLQRASHDQLRIVRTVDELRACWQEGRVGAVVHFEGAEPIDPGLDLLDAFYEVGLRSLGPVWSRQNDFGEGVPYLFPHSPDTGPGLSDVGRELIRRCNQLGILVDVSHLNERGFWDVASLSSAPLVATHSNAHALTPSPRNLTDRQLDAIAESEGIVGINFYVGFVRADGREDTDTPISRIVEHIEYIVQRIGIEHVGFGTDFDGAAIPDEIGDVAGLPRIMLALREVGYDEPALRKLAHENWLRVLSATWRPARIGSPVEHA